MVHEFTFRLVEDKFQLTPIHTSFLPFIHK